MVRVCHIIQYWVTENPDLQERVKGAILKTIELAVVQKVILFVQGSPDLSVFPSSKVEIVRINERMSYGDFLRCASAPEYLQYDLISCSNSDIILTEDIAQLVPLAKKTLIALTRREKSGELFRYQECSQDAWFLRPEPIPGTIIDSANFRLGISGCELRFAAEMMCHGYDVYNPSESIRIFHNDDRSDATSGNNPSSRYGGLYLRTKPCSIDQMREGKVGDYYELHVKRYDPGCNSFKMIKLQNPPLNENNP